LERRQNLRGVNQALDEIGVASTDRGAHTLRERYHTVTQNEMSCSGAIAGAGNQSIRNSVIEFRIAERPVPRPNHLSDPPELGILNDGEEDCNAFVFC
jgi:hypothetical protein